MSLLWLLACHASPTKETGSAPGTVPTNGDPCDAIGEPAVVLGTLDDAGAFAPWSGEATFATGAPAPTATAPSETLSIGIAAPNLEIDEFTYVELVATDGGTELFSSSIPVGFACDAANGPVGVARVDWTWTAVVGDSVSFSATLTDVTGRSANGTGTVTISGPPAGG